MYIIECNALTKNYGKTSAISNLSINIEDNKITGLVGRNGAGKTTLLKIMAGFLKKSEGEVRVFNENPFNNLKVAANTVFVDDNLSFPQGLNLNEILGTAGQFYKNWDMLLAKRLLDYFSLNPNQSHLNLSKGMRSTFNMIFGISAHCQLTILDEPTTGMDSAVRKDFYKALLKDYVEAPRTIIISSHHINEIEDLIEDVLLINDGKKHLHMPITDLKAKAVGIRGKTELVGSITRDREIYYKESLGVNNLYVVTNNNYTEAELYNAKLSGLEILPLSTDDICVYLTAKARGGIEDVFNRSKSL